MENRIMDIDDLLKFSSYQDIEIPQKIENRINYTLANKKRKNKGLMFAIKNIIMTIFATIIVGFTGLVVYAGFGGTINNVPTFEWLGIKLNNYDKYKEEVIDKKVTYDETSIELVSTLSGNYMTILEFDVKLSDKDIEYLKLGQSVLSQAEYDEVDKKYARLALQRYVKQEEANDIKDIIELDENNQPDLDKTPQDIIDRAVKWYEDYNLNIENFYGFIPKDENKINEFKKNAYTRENLYANMEKNWSGYINTVMLNFNGLLIDGEKTRMKTFQTVQKIEDNYYKVFDLYLILEESLEEKTNFNINTGDIELRNVGEKISTNGKKEYMQTNANVRTIHIPGGFDVEINQDKVNENTKVYENLDYNSEYKNMTNSIEKITVTPYQTIMVVKSTITGIDNDTRYYIDEETQWPMFFNYDITDKDGNSLSNMSYEVKRTMLKKNGVVENWAPGDIQAMSYFNDATIEYISYLLIENKQENTELKIVPTFEAFKRPEDVEPDTSGIVMEKMPMIKINLE